MDWWGEEIPLDDLMSVVGFPVYEVPVPLVAALNLVTTAPESFRWIRVDRSVDGLRIFLDRQQATQCRADALLMLAVWIAETGLPVPTATAVYRTHSERFLDLDGTHIDVLAALASVNVIDGDRAAVSVDRLAAGLPPVPSEAIESRLVDLARFGLVAPDPDGWLLRSDPPRQASTGPDTYMTNFGPMSVLVLDGMAESRRLEGWGLHLVQKTMARIQQAPGGVLRAALAPPVPGPEFDYSSSQPIFSGRAGSGPLYIAWDTNLLIDYFDHGGALWRGGQLPEDMEKKNFETLDALEILIALWVVRDIRMVLLPHILDDYRETLSQAHYMARLRALDRFEAALGLSEAGEADLDAISREGLLYMPARAQQDALENALQFVPAGGDRELVRQAVARGVHIFLTKDKRIFRASDRLAPFGLHITRPPELLQELVEAGAYNCLFAPEKMDWSLPDQQRVANLIEALSNSGL